ncbi:MAG: hypothetical protein LEGION0403_FIIPPAGN_01714 [Legionella sp.]|uniref:hypothetical protein n=1 Tax=Legionella sp. TaxID=459 RepID=UPI003D14E3C5
MPQNTFNASFMSPPGQNKITDYSVLYGEVPLYFTPTSATALKEQLAFFRKTSDFSFFQRQYETLLDNLKTWCDRHECGILLNDALTNNGEPSPAFALLKNYLFGANHYFEENEAAFFNEGKKNLEELCLLLKNEHIPLDGKLKVLRELQTGLNVCADGIQTNIRNATNELKAHLGINEALQQIKTEFIQQHALPTIQSLFGDNQDYEAFEIHYVNAYYNHVAKDFGLSEQDDSYIPAAERNITPFNRLHFKKRLQEQFTPYRMLGLLLVKLRDDWTRLHAELSDKLKELRTNWNTITNPELLQIMGQNALFSQEQILFTNALEQWNQKYGALITLSFYDLSEVDDNGVIVLHDLPTLTTLLEPQIIKKFSQQYLEAGNQFRLQIEPNLTLCAHHGLLWCERTQIPEVITLEHVKKINPEHLSLEEQVQYCFVLNQLFEQLPEERVELSHRVHALDKPLLDLIWEQELIDCILHLDFRQQGRLLNRYAQENQPGAQKLITRYPDKLLSYLCALHVYPEHDRSFESLFNIHYHCEGIGETTLLGYAVHAYYWGLIEKLAEYDWFTTKHLLTPIHYKTHREVNLLWILVLEQRWELLDELIAHNLITETQLASRPLNEESGLKGTNVLHLLGKYQQWDTIEKLLLRGCTAELLTPTGLEGVNLLWILATKQKWNLIKILVERDLISSTMLAAMPTVSNFQRMNVLSLLGYSKQWELLKQLFNRKELITTELLEPTPLQGINQGINLLWILVNNRKWDLINILVERDLISPTILAAMPTVGDFQGMNVLSLLGCSKQWELLKQLFNQNELITTELLEPRALQGVNQGINLLWILANNRKWDLISLLVEHDLISPTMLAAMPTVGDSMGRNVLYLFALNKQWELLEQLLNRYEFITRELLTPSAHKGVNLLWVLTKNQKWDLINILLQKNLISSPMLAATSMDANPSQGSKALHRLVYHQQWELLKKLFNQEGLITTELLTSTESTGVNAGLNLLWILANHQQWGLINIVVQHDLINQPMLAVKLMEGNIQGINVLYQLGIYKQWDTLQTLFNREGLITVELLEPTSLVGITRGTNLLWILAKREKWDLINMLLLKGLIKAPMLAAMSFEGVQQGISVLYLCAQGQKWDIIKELLSQKIITSELLAPLTQGGENQGTDVLTLLINAQQWALIDTLLQQNLLTAEQKHLIPEENNLLSTNTQYTPAFFNVVNNNEFKRKTMDEQDESSDEPNLKKSKP